MECVVCFLVATHSFSRQLQLSYSNVISFVFSRLILSSPHRPVSLSSLVVLSHCLVLLSYLLFDVSLYYIVSSSPLVFSPCLVLSSCHLVLNSSILLLQLVILGWGQWHFFQVFSLAPPLKYVCNTN